MLTVLLLAARYISLRKICKELEPYLESQLEVSRRTTDDGPTDKENHGIRLISVSDFNIIYQISLIP